MRWFRSSAGAAGALRPFPARLVSLSSRVVVAVALSTGSATALAHDYALHDLHIEHPYARPTPPGARTGGAYFTIRNAGRLSDRLVRVSSAAAKRAEMHSMTMDGNVMRMRALQSLDIPAGSTTTLGSGGYHIMLVDLARPLAAGDKVPLALTFERAGTIDVIADVEAAPVGAQAHAH